MSAETAEGLGHWRHVSVVFWMTKSTLPIIEGRLRSPHRLASTTIGDVLLHSGFDL